MTGAVVRHDDAGVRVRAFGPLSLTCRGEDVTPTAPRLRQLIGLLAAASGAAVRTESVTEELWPDGAPAGHTRSIQTYVWQIRRLVGGTRPADAAAPIRHAARVGYSFDLSAVTLDVVELRFARERAEALLAGGSPEEAADELVRGVELCRGPALHDVPLGPVLGRRRRQLDNSRLAVLTRCLQTLERLDRPEQVLSYFERVMQESVLVESLYAPMITALDRIGQRSAAVELFHWARRGCIEATGLEPGPVLRAAGDRALSDDPAPARIAPAGRPSGESYGSTPSGGTWSWTPVHQVPEPVDAGGVDPTSVERVIAGLAPDPGAGGRRVVRVTGPPRSGRSSLCRVVAARVASMFPDGTLHADLRALTPDAALTTLLRTVTGGRAELPVTLPERAELWRRLTTDRRVLIVVEGVDLVHVPLFLPGSHTAAVLVDSRSAAPSAAVTHTVVLAAPTRVDPHDDAMVASVLASLDRVVPQARALLLAAAGRVTLGLRISPLMTAAQFGLSPVAATLALDDLVDFGFARRYTDAQGPTWYDVLPTYTTVLAEIARREGHTRPAS